MVAASLKARYFLEEDLMQEISGGKQFLGVVPIQKWGSLTCLHTSKPMEMNNSISWIGKQIVSSGAKNEFIYKQAWITIFVASDIDNDEKTTAIHANCNKKHYKLTDSRVVKQIDAFDTLNHNFMWSSWFRK